MSLTGFNGSAHHRTASLPASWGFPSLEEQQANLAETFPGTNFQPHDSRILPAIGLSGIGHVYAPRRGSLEEFYSVSHYSELTWRITQRAQLDFNLAIMREVLDEEVTPDETLFDQWFNLEDTFRHDWNIIPLSTGWQHQGYSADQTVTRCLANRQYPLGLWQYAALMMAFRPKLESAENHFLICAADQLRVDGRACCPKFRLHHTVELGWQDRTTADVYSGALAYIMS